MHPTGKLVHLHAMYTKTGIFAVCKYNILRDPSYMGVQTGIELHMINTIYAALPVRTNRKDDIFMQRRLVQNFTIILE